MKISFYKLSFLVFILFTAFSCSGDDEGNSTNNDPDINGLWEWQELRLGNRSRFAPDGESIFIRFSVDEFEGNTSRNEFFGDYRTNNGQLTLNNFGTSEVNETDWGNLFYFSLASGYNDGQTTYSFPYEITDEGLIIERADNEFMVFIER